MARQRGSRWQADVLIGGTRQRKAFATKAEAEAFETAVAGGYVPSAASTLGAYRDERFEALWGTARSRKYIEGNWRVIDRYLPLSTPLEKVDNAAITRLVEGLKRDGKQGGTINRKLANLRKLLKDAHKHGRILYLPQGLDREPEGNQRERVLDAEEEAAAIRFFEHTGREASGHLFVFLLYTGLRVGEALSLDRKHVRGKQITIHHTKAKNKSTRTITLVSKAATAWNAVCARTNSSTPFQALIPYWTFRDHWAALKVHLGVEDDKEFVPHMLRHSCATRLVRAGVPLPHVMKWMGHRSMQVTLRYTHLVPHDLDIAAQALEEV